MLQGCVSRPLLRRPLACISVTTVHTASRVGHSFGTPEAMDRQIHAPWPVWGSLVSDPGDRERLAAGRAMLTETAAG